MGNDGLYELIAANAPYWSAEAEIIRTYWTSEVRTPDTDKRWVLHQCYKEYWDGFIPPFNRLTAELNEIDTTVPRETALVHAETLAEEFAHYCAFADVYEALRIEDEPRISPPMLKTAGNWDANVELVELRKQHKRDHGELGHRAHFFTEGGYCTLYSEGMALAGRGGIDDKIAKACELVWEDEFGHMLMGIVGLAEKGMTDPDWELMIDMTVAQMRSRLAMRNAQFDYPVGEGRLREMSAGKCEPMPFDWERAGIQAPEKRIGLPASS